MLKIRIIDTATNKDLHTYPDPSGRPTLVTTDYGRLHGHFASVTATAGTTTIVAPKGGEGIAITDLIVNIAKGNGASATVQFEDADGNGPIILAVLDAETSTGRNMSIPFQGKFTGWKAARIEVVVAVSTANVTVGYYRIPEDNTLSYSEWNATR